MLVCARLVVPCIRTDSRNTIWKCLSVSAHGVNDFLPVVWQNYIDSCVSTCGKCRTAFTQHVALTASADCMTHGLLDMTTIGVVAACVRRLRTRSMLVSCGRSLCTMTISAPTHLWTVSAARLVSTADTVIAVQVVKTIRRMIDRVA